MRVTKKQIRDNQERFDNLMKRVDLVKAGAIMLRVQRNDLIRAYQFAYRYLSLNNISPSMVHQPTVMMGRDTAYSDVFICDSFDAYCKDRLKRNTR